MSTVTPSYTDSVSVIAAQVLARGSTVRGTTDLRAKFGAYLFAKIGRGGTTALSGGTTAGVTVLIRRVLNNDGGTAGAVHPAGSPAFLSSTAAASATTVNADSAAGAPTLNVASSSGFAANDVVCVQDSGGGVTRLEWQRVSKTAAGVLTMDRNLTFAHTAAQADTVRNQADVFAPVWVPGGSLIEVIFDYGQDTAGDSVTVQALAQTYEGDQIA